MGKVIEFPGGDEGESILREFLELAKEGGGPPSGYDEICKKLLSYIQRRLEESREQIEDVDRRVKELSRRNWKIFGYLFIGVLLYYISFYFDLWGKIPVPEKYQNFVRTFSLFLFLGLLFLGYHLLEGLSYSEQRNREKWRQAIKREAHLWKKEILQIRLMALNCQSDIEKEILRLLERWEALANRALED